MTTAVDTNKTCLDGLAVRMTSEFTGILGYIIDRIAVRADQVNGILLLVLSDGPDDFPSSVFVFRRNWPGRHAAMKITVIGMPLENSHKSPRSV